jgi:hypothetical protein
VSTDQTGIVVELRSQSSEKVKVTLIQVSDLNVGDFVVSLRSSTSAIATQGTEIELARRG